MWCENIWTLIESSVALRNTRFRMITLCTASAGGAVTSEIGRPTLRPPPVNPDAAPMPTIVLSDVTLCICGLAGSWIIPRTQMTSGPPRAMALVNSAAVSTSTVGPPAPPVVPFWPRALTDAKPIGPVDGWAQLPGGSVGPTVGVAVVVGFGLPSVLTTRSSKDALAKYVENPTRPDARLESLALTTCTPLTKPRRLVPNASRRSVYQVPMVTASGADASVVGPPPTRLPRITDPALGRPRK